MLCSDNSLVSHRIKYNKAPSWEWRTENKTNGNKFIAKSKPVCPCFVYLLFLSSDSFYLFQIFFYSCKNNTAAVDASNCVCVYVQRSFFEGNAMVMQQIKFYFRLFVEKNMFLLVLLASRVVRALHCYSLELTTSSRCLTTHTLARIL